MAKTTKAVKNKTFAVIGLGRFGTALAKALNENGADVLAVDEDRDRINAIEPFCTQAVCADPSDERILVKLGIHNFDLVFVTLSQIESSVFVTLTCKQLGVKKLFAKALNSRHREILEKIGADRVFVPEEEMGEKIAGMLLKPNMIEIMPLSGKFKMVEIITPEKWQHQSLLELDLRNTEKVAVILIKRGEEILATPNGSCVLLPDDILVVAGENQNIDKLSNKATKEVPTEE